LLPLIITLFCHFLLPDAEMAYAIFSLAFALYADADIRLLLIFSMPPALRCRQFSLGYVAFGITPPRLLFSPCYA